LSQEGATGDCRRNDEEDAAGDSEASGALEAIDVQAADGRPGKGVGPETRPQARQEGAPESCMGNRLRWSLAPGDSSSAASCAASGQNQSGRSTEARWNSSRLEKSQRFMELASLLRAGFRGNVKTV
jgi:hypothetical protein